MPGSMRKKKAYEDKEFVKAHEGCFSPMKKASLNSHGGIPRREIINGNSTLIKMVLGIVA